MLIRAQKTESGRIIIVDSAHVAAWEVSDAGTLFADLQSGECVRMGRFANQEKALNFVGRIQSKILGGALAMAVPSLTEQNIEKESAQWD